VVGGRERERTNLLLLRDLVLLNDLSELSVDSSGLEEGTEVLF